ncbi:MAG: dihydrofolate reductase [Candidatus Saccharimonadales bacterium]
MIKAILAIDQANGLATDAGIPWDIPTDQNYVHQTISTQPVVMGYRTYQEMKVLPKNDPSFVVIHPGTKLRDGFVAVSDVNQLIKKYQNSKQTLWVIGGAKIYQELLPQTQELYVTRVGSLFNCTKFFPEFEAQYTMIETSPPKQENGIPFHFEIWRRNV